MPYTVYSGQNSIGIVETNYAWAKPYWDERSRATGKKFVLRCDGCGWTAGHDSRCPEAGDDMIRQGWALHTLGG